MTSAPNLLTWPPFYCPIAKSVSPQAALIDENSTRWLDKFELYRNQVQRDYLARGNTGLFAAASLPEGSLEGLQAASDHLLWLYTFDDTYCDEKPGGSSPDELVALAAKMARVIEAPHARVLDGNPWAAALRDLRLRLESFATPTQVGRWVEEFTRYFIGLPWEATNRRNGIEPQLDDYAQMWSYVDGMLPSVMFTDMACGYEVPEAEMRNPRVRALTEMACTLVGWDNDIISYNKEVYRSDRYGYAAIQNLVSVLANRDGSSTEEALAEAVLMRDRVMCLFLALQRQEAARGSEELARYVTGLGQWVRGYLDFSFESNRYGNPVNPGDTESVHIDVPGLWAAEPVDAGLLPLPVPSIAWWWEQLDPAPTACG